MPSFKDAISRPGRINLIAEIKRRSPSAGIIINSDFDPGKIAKIYERSGACAISVLTNTKLFGGSLKDLKLVKKATSLPVLRKDFITTEKQVEESVLIKSDAILLIARRLTNQQLNRLFKMAKEARMDVIIEVHTKEDVSKALNLNARIIGINNRDLETLKIDLKTTERLVKLLPKDTLIISESGITTRRDVKYLTSLGVNAILVGEALLKSKDIQEKVRELIGERL